MIWFFQMRIKEISRTLKPIISSHPEIKLVYLFGSQVSGNTGVLSDYDFAFYVDRKDTKILYDLKFILMDEIGLALRTDKIDIVILNLIQSPELKYKIIKDGVLLFKEEPYKVLVEPQILNEYFDFHDLLVRYNLTKA
ncbi:MAG: nucleotidyltransferase domain-containing protein [Candidatus Scalindua sp. AMX11]|nr:MAG: nucleotidyltransferase domain-containing protein [Candidatus Scalindua sp.]RZV93922.1 MAG: nucleotidyltransferase domain-containing protein [Candidatus Scalindua sp. SCAELEC01]TDE65543.1 MAG: nucleotidyltransferase domain-containing protein [Candidatus Scalindua sp. AMX11]